MHPYTMLTLALELDDARCAEAKEIVRRTFLAPQQDTDYAQMATALPALHFMAVVVFTDEHLDPLLTIELNFDGPPGPFFASLEQAYGPDLRALLRCAKPPRDGNRALFDAVTAPDSRAPIAPCLERCAVTPVTPYRGARGFSRARIEAEAAIHDAAQTALGDGLRFAGGSAAEVHRALREDARLAPLLDGPAPEERPWRRPLDWLALLGLVVGLYALLGAPGLVAGWLLDPWVVLAALAASVALVVAGWPELRTFLGIGTAGDAAPRPGGAVAVALTAVCVLAALVLALAGLHAADLIPAPRAVAGWGGGFWAAAAGYLAWLLAGLAAVALVVLALLAALRRHERADPIHDPAVPGARTQEAITAMAQREDQIGQNHMGSLLIAKPGTLRAALLRINHLLLSRLARTVFSDGFLGPMRTIHFAHWCILDRGARLVFFSNFDGSWDSYLSDFTEKASGGVNLAWANCIGFPEGAFLVGGGSRNGRQFKAWARHSMAPTLFWFSAYRDLSVNEIHRNARVAAGLRRASLADAAVWARDL